MENSLGMALHYNVKVFAHNVSDYGIANYSPLKLFTYTVAIVGSSYGNHCW